MAEDSARKATTGDTEENYQTYLHDVLADLGIQLSPGGMGVVEIDRSLSGDEDPGGGLYFADSPPEATEGNKPTQRENAAKKRKTVKTDSRASETSCDISTDEADAVKSPVSSEEFAEKPSTSNRCPERKRKRKAYEVDKPFQDPERERKRVNAITARRNREKKKKEIDSLRRDVRNLSHVNRQCNKALKRTNADIQKLHEQLASSRKLVTSLQETIDQKEKELRGLREKFLLFRGHLELIVNSLDDDNPAKKLIASLLKTLPAEADAI
ncbi:uncharacterized protein LOC125032963 isoform X1 [Penaeus chinensis]|uniref:uncharacterized protein LOC125032963 isoform X1 n=1 Tax=Penaeus chinensis TaxID=139456 RepID=UPI001FB74132|nr:uncharacterized protein LOC125032963 isoform X1 [Penaeus chinensis]